MPFHKKSYKNKTKRKLLLKNKNKKTNKNTFKTGGTYSRIIFNNAVKSNIKQQIKILINEFLEKELGDPVKIADKINLIKIFYDDQTEKDNQTKRKSKTFTPSKTYMFESVTTPMATYMNTPSIPISVGLSKLESSSVISLKSPKAERRLNNIADLVQEIMSLKRTPKKRGEITPTKLPTKNEIKRLESEVKRSLIELIEEEVEYQDVARTLDYDDNIARRLQFSLEKTE